jgi:8-oxo-dGTP pyrophosphatase MutT (NUDIX family)
MDFHQFNKLLPKIQNSPLLGDEAHFLLAPPSRQVSMDFYKSKPYEPKLAAVNLLFYPKKNDTYLLFIKRTADQSVHSQQIAFPGGKKDAEDLDMQYTALRELEEEVGITSNLIEVIKPLSQLYIPPSKFEVHPFAIVAKQPLVFVPQVEEIAEILEIPLSFLLSDDSLTETTLNTSYATNLSCPVFKWENHIIWGATAMIMSEMREILRRLV